MPATTMTNAGVHLFTQNNNSALSGSMTSTAAGKGETVASQRGIIINLTDDLKARLRSVAKLPQSQNNHALQVVCLQARAWAADENDQACRPWYILCLEIYPRGKVINQTVHKPASERPSPSDMLHFILKHMEKPPDGERSVRPTHISFVDREVSSALQPHLSRLKIKCEHLTIADGVKDYMSKFSDRLVESDKATRGESGERPGMMSGKEVTTDIVNDLMRSVVEMYKAQPWTRIPEHVALEVRLPSEPLLNGNSGLGSSSTGNTMGNGNGYGSTIGSSNASTVRQRVTIDRKKIRKRDKFYVTVLGCDDTVYGFVLMSSLAMLRDKYRRVMGKRTGIPMPTLDGDENNSMVSALASDVFVCGACGRRVGEEGPGTERWVNRCSACERLFYCDEECQRRDWGMRHRNECEAAQKDSEYVFTRPEWAWIDREVALLFLDPTAVPFDDLDGFQEHGWEMVDSTSPPLYALPVVSVQSSDGMSSKRDVPTAKEIIALTQVANGLKECVSPPPKDGTVHLSNGLSVSLAENLADNMPLPSELES